MNGISSIGNASDLMQLNRMTLDLLRRKDVNGDKSLTSDEFGASLDVFSNIDQNGDGKLDPVELNKAYMSQSGGSSQSLDDMSSALISGLDQNGDELLSADEMKVSSSVFSGIDADGSGTAGINELNAAFTAAHPIAQYMKTMNSTNEKKPLILGNIIA